MSTTSPVATPTPVAPGTSPPVGAPSPVSTTVGSTQTVTTRPLTSGDSFSYAGTIVTSFVYNGSSPKPSTTSVAAVTQTVTLSGPTSFNGNSGLTDVNTAESDTTPLLTTTVASDAYEALASASAGQELIIDSSRSTTSDGYTIATNYANPFVLDLLPETAGASFTNSPAQTINESEPGGFSSTRTYASDGSYTDTENYPANSGGSGNSPSATIIEYHQGSGSYSLPLQGYSANTIITVGSPIPATSGAPSTIPLTLQVPDPTVSPVMATVQTWYAQPLDLYKETDLQTGSKPLPAPCNVPTSIATSANALVTQIERVDTVLGVDETSSQIGYVAPMYGLVCMQLTDVSKDFYDFSGVSIDGPSISGTLVPLEVDTVEETIGMSAVDKLNSNLRAGGVPISALRAGPARGAFEVAVARLRAARVRRAIEGLSQRANGTVR